MLYDIFLIIYYLGCVYGLWLVFGKAGIARWKALIPVYHFIPWVKMCGKEWKWYIYLLLPAINIFVFLLLVVEIAKVFRRYNFWEQLFSVIFPWIYLPLVGLSKWEYHDPKTDPPAKVSEARDWADAIAFALVAAVIIRGNVVEFYKIPTSSMEKSLLTGDYVLVSKLAYGPRTAMTPLSLPLVHNVVPLTGGQVESFLPFIQMPYHRYPGLGDVKRFDPIVFNYPDGDTACTAYGSNVSYYDLVREYGREAVWNMDKVKLNGQWVPNKIRVRPVDKRENFVKRCIGLPGEEVRILNQVVYINDVPVLAPKHSQQSYLFESTVLRSMDEMLDMLESVGVSEEDRGQYLTQARRYQNPEVVLTEEMAFRLSQMPNVRITPCIYPVGDSRDFVFPKSEGYDWTRDNFGPVHIPAKGETIQLNLKNLPIYYRAIRTFEGNTVEVKDSTILINGVPADSYTFKMNYYWAMGDSRHNSADSRYWGFVPEDHLVGKASLVVFSWDGDHRKVRWERIFRSASRMD